MNEGDRIEREAFVHDYITALMGKYQEHGLEFTEAEGWRARKRALRKWRAGKLEAEVKGLFGRWLKLKDRDQAVCHFFGSLEVAALDEAERQKAIALILPMLERSVAFAEREAGAAEDAEEGAA